MKYGLDFGTTNTAIAIKKDGKGTVLSVDSSATDSRVIRTMLYFLRRELIISNKVPQSRLNSLTFLREEINFQGKEEFLIGQAAANQHMAENKFRKPGTIRKILTGRMVKPDPGADPVEEYYFDIDYGIGRLLHSIKTALKAPTYKGTSIFGEFYTLEELISTFVTWIKQSADRTLNEDIDELVVGRPVYFSYDPEEDKVAQDRLEKALQLAGFKKITFVYEPIAAAEQFISTINRADKLVFVFDFGGGTLDTAIVQSGIESKVLAADGVYIGGDLLNADIVQDKLWPYFGSQSTWGHANLPMPIHIYQNLRSWFNIADLNNPETMESLRRLKYQNSDPEALNRLIYLIQANLGFDLYEAVEKAKKQLTTADSARIIFRDGPIDMDIEITRAEFEQIIEIRVEEVKKVVLRTLEKAQVTPEQIDVLVRTGGSSLIPVFEEMLVEIFNKEKIQQFETFTSIASGLALMD